MMHIKKLILSLALSSCLHTVWAEETPGDIIDKAELALQYNDTKIATTLLLPLAEQGNPRAQYLLTFAMINLKGSGEWLKKSADQGYIFARFFLAFDKAKKDKTPIPKDIIDNVRALADNNDKMALERLLSLSHVYTLLEIKSDINFEHYLRKAAQQSVASAQKQLSDRYAKEGNALMAIFWARKMAISEATEAKKGNIASQHLLGDIYNHGSSWFLLYEHTFGLDSIDKSPSLAVYWYQQAAQKLPRTNDSLGKLYLNRYRPFKKDAKKATLWFEKAVEQGEDSSAKSLVLLYGNGDDNLAKNLAKAKKYHSIYLADLIKKLEDGNYYYKPNVPSLQTDIGKEYANAPTGVQNFREAEKWFKKAYAQDYSKAAIELGRIYLNKNNPNHDFDIAKKWLKKASEKGETDAMFELGEAYFTGESTTQDFEVAEQWFKKAIDKDENNYSAINRLKDIPLYKKYQRSNKSLTAGIIATIKKNKVEAKKILKPFAEAGNAEAQYYFSKAKAPRWGGPDVTWLKKSAEGGFAKAQMDVAKIYTNDGSLNEKQRKEATLLWINKAIEQDYPEAIFTLAKIYNGYDNWLNDDKKALELYEKLLTLDDIDDYREEAKAAIKRIKRQFESQNNYLK